MDPRFYHLLQERRGFESARASVAHRQFAHQADSCLDRHSFVVELVPLMGLAHSAQGHDAEGDAIVLGADEMDAVLAYIAAKEHQLGAVLNIATEHKTRGDAWARAMTQAILKPWCGTTLKRKLSGDKRNPRVKWLVQAPMQPLADAIWATRSSAVNEAADDAQRLRNQQQEAEDSERHMQQLANEQGQRGTRKCATCRLPIERDELVQCEYTTPVLDFLGQPFGGVERRTKRVCRRCYDEQQQVPRE